MKLVVQASAFDLLMGYGLVEAMDKLVQSRSHDMALAVTYLRSGTHRATTITHQRHENSRQEAGRQAGRGSWWSCCLGSVRS